MILELAEDECRHGYVLERHQLKLLADACLELDRTGKILSLATT